ncbi:hypothetical protein HY732_02405 [Candidatus Uhrbacteria bacterium]|nr:hypothetical protein [Candidatus Uhrbacteria bacterium]
MGDTQLAKKIENIEQRLSFLEGGGIDRYQSIHSNAQARVWKKTHGILSAKRAMSLSRRISQNRKQWTRRSIHS